MRADVMIVLGTSLTVFPAAGIPRLTLQKGGKVFIVNAQPTPLDAYAAARYPDLREFADRITGDFDESCTGMARHGFCRGKKPGSVRRPRRLLKKTPPPGPTPTSNSFRRNVPCRRTIPKNWSHSRKCLRGRICCLSFSLSGRCPAG